MPKTDIREKLREIRSDRFQESANRFAMYDLETALGKSAGQYEQLSDVMGSLQTEITELCGEVKELKEAIKELVSLHRERLENG